MERSLQNFDIGGERERMPVPVVRAFGVLKKVHRYKVKLFFFVFCAFFFQAFQATIQS